MDRRTLLAFVIIGLIIVVMPYYMRLISGDPIESPVEITEIESVRDAPETERSRPIERDKEQGVEDQLQRTDISAPSVPPVPPVPDRTGGVDFEPQDVIIDTDNYHAVISTKGGVITSWRLKTYADRNGDWLELIPLNRSGLGLAIDGASLNDLEFRPDQTRIELTGPSQAELVLTAQCPQGQIQKRLRFQGNRYRTEFTVAAPGLSNQSRIGVVWDGALADTEGQTGGGGFYAGKYEQVAVYWGGDVDTWNVDRIQGEEEPPFGQISWVGIRNKYFLAAMIPEEGRYSLVMEGQSQENEFGVEVPNYRVEMIPEAPDFEGQTFGVFIGPISYDVLRGQNRDLDGVQRELDFDEFVDYGPSFMRSILKPVTIGILRAFLAIHQIVPNYGVVIILFSLLVKIVVFPLTHKSLESAAKMQQLQPKMAELREKFGSDSQKMNQAMMKLYKEEKINPLGGCLPMVLQMPILFSLFSLFRGTIELRQADFFLWITDLSQPESLAVGSFNLHVLPLLMGTSMFIQQKMTMKDPKQAALVYIMPVFLTYIFWSMSSGLVFYYTLYNVLTLLQQVVMEQTKKGLGTA